MTTAIRTGAEISRELGGYLERLRRRLDALPAGDTAVSVVMIVRHGYATTRVCLESLYAMTSVRFMVFYLDINSPPAVQRYLAGQSRTREHFFHIRIDEHVSRQTARRLVLDMIPTRYTVFVDNNILFGENWLEHLVNTAERDAASVVSPLIVMHGGNVHFSGATIEPLEGGFCARRQTTKEAPMAARLEDTRPEKMEIDFAESHCCLVRTDCFRGRAAEFFPEAMHNSHTMAVATQRMRRRTGCRMLIEPESIVSILPIGAGYDIPWLFECYSNLSLLKTSYVLMESESGRSVSTSLSNLKWHRKHLLYLLLSMTRNGNLARPDMLRPEEVPAYVDGYDRRLPRDALYRIRKTIAPFVKEHYPGCRRALDMWMYEVDEMISSIDDRIRDLEAIPPPAKRLGISIVICTHNGARLLPDTLRSVAALENRSGREWELIVVDNASTDDTSRRVNELCPPEIRDRLRLLEEPRLGVGLARLKGLYGARYEVVSFVDDDNWLPQDWLDAVAEVLESRPDVGVVGTYSEPVFEVEPPPWFDAVKSQFAVGPQGDHVGDITRQRAYVWGAGSSYRADALKAAVAHFNGTVMMGRQGRRVLSSGEDNEFCYMLRATGWKVWYDPAIRFRHYIPEGKLNWSYVRRMNRGFGESSIGLARYKADRIAPAGSSWYATWQMALFHEARQMWRMRRQVLRVLLGRSRGDASTLPVYRCFGKITALLRVRKAYNESIEYGHRMASRDSEPATEQ